MIVNTYTSGKPAGFALPGRVRATWLCALPTSPGVVTDQGTRLLLDGRVAVSVDTAADQHAFPGTSAWSPPPQ